MVHAAWNEDDTRVDEPETCANHEQLHEISNIARDEYATFLRCNSKKILIAQTFELQFFISGADVVPQLPQSRPNSLAGDVRIEEEPQPGLGTMVGYKACHSSSVRWFSATKSSISAGYCS